MRTLDKYIIKADEGSFNKSKGGLITPTFGEESEKYQQVAEIYVPLTNGKYKKGDKVVVQHTVFNTEVLLEEGGLNKYRLAEPFEILGYYEGEQLKSHTHLICSKIIRTTHNYVHEVRKEVPNMFRVEYSPTDDYDVGDEIYIPLHYDYPIDHLEVVFVELDVVIKNETKDTLHNGYVLMEAADNQEFVLGGSGLYIPNKDYRTCKGTWENKQYIFRRDNNFNLYDNIFAVTKDNIYAEL